ncbi:hypothetical protein Dsin_022508 [Dipteronia sinensis]|uniref:Uncharacterized protein n=1 Tax=Dipteronia sinensis TaxID=43782 RepID=A0AAE0A1I9_9ROSI|nr:hypothetical protein Dsin_022508 [Dipteronia sinensis]
MRNFSKRLWMHGRWYGKGVLKRVRIYHGISGNTYAFLALYQLTSKVEYLYKAKAFACFLLDRAQKLISKGKIYGGDRPYSLFEGIGRNKWPISFWT